MFRKEQDIYCDETRVRKVSKEVSNKDDNEKMNIHREINRPWPGTCNTIGNSIIIEQKGLSKNIFVKIHDIQVAGIANIHHHMIPVLKKNPSYIIFRVVTNDGKFITSHEILAGIYQSSFTSVCF